MHINLTIRLPISLSICPPIWLYVFKPASKSIYLSCVPISVRIFLSAKMSLVSTCLPFSLPVCLPIYIYQPQSINLSVRDLHKKPPDLKTWKRRPVSGQTATPVRRESRSSRPNNILQEDGHPNDIPVTSMVMEYPLQRSSHCCLGSQF